LVLQPRQPSTILDIDWLYETSGETIHIVLDDTGWTLAGVRLLRATVNPDTTKAGGG